MPRSWRPGLRGIPVFVRAAATPGSGDGDGVGCSAMVP